VESDWRNVEVPREGAAASIGPSRLQPSNYHAFEQAVAQDVHRDLFADLERIQTRAGRETSQNCREERGNR